MEPFRALVRPSSRLSDIKDGARPPCETKSEACSRSARWRAILKRSLEDNMFKKLLVPVDIGDEAMAKASLEAAKALAEPWGAEVRLLHVRPILPSAYLEYVPADFEGLERKRATEDLAALAGKLGLPAGKVSTSVRTGGVYHEVLAEADDCKADLIIVSSHWPTLATYLIGSHATNIVRHAHCSVLVVRA
jgi:nucleotide-binding universal stress UspA family protein